MRAPLGGTLSLAMGLVQGARPVCIAGSGCLDLYDGAVLGEASTVGGVARFEVTVPPGLRHRGVAAFLPAPAERSATNRIEVVDPLDDEDGDGLTNQLEHRLGSRLDRADTDRDGIDDGREVALGSDPAATDTDGDGLEDFDELAAGTRLDVADTDGDGLVDGDELALGADPLLVDTDGDGLDDAAEVVFGTSPSRADSDGDGLADGTEWVLLSDGNSRDTDGDGTQDDVEVANGLDPTHPDTDRDGLPDALEPLSGGDPLLADTDDDGLLDEAEVYYGSDPAAADSDLDGLVDIDELLWHTDPTLADSDGDGLGDHDEVLLGLDPRTGDSDGDGLPDDVELAVGLDPLDSDSDDGRNDANEVDRGTDARVPDGPIVCGTCAVAGERDVFSNVVVSTPEELVAFADVTQVSGSLDILVDADVVLPNLEYVGGQVRIVGGTDRILLPGLTYAGDLVVDAPRAVDVSVPALDEVDTVDLDVPSAETLSLPSLVTTDRLEIRAVQPGFALDLPVLEEVDRLTLDLEGVGSTVSWPRVVDVDTLTVRESPAHLVVPPTRLLYVTDSVHLSRLDVGLVTGRVDVRGCHGLERLEGRPASLNTVQLHELQSLEAVPVSVLSALGEEGSAAIERVALRGVLDAVLRGEVRLTLRHTELAALDVVASTGRVRLGATDNPWLTRVGTQGWRLEELDLERNPSLLEVVVPGAARSGRVVANHRLDACAFSGLSGWTVADNHPLTCRMPQP